jgi:hypothetical protein
MRHHFDITSVVQINPPHKRENSFLPLGVVNRSPTWSLESRNRLAGKHRAILYRNPKEATQELVWHILIPLSIPEINRIREKVFGYLSKVGVNAIANIEPTTDGDFNNPIGTVHFHILTDDGRGEKFLRKLLTESCLAAGLRNRAVSGVSKDEFEINYRRLTNYRKYIRYFTKHNRLDKVHLFAKGSRKQPGTRMQLFYEIGTWYVDTEGNPKGKGKMWDEIKQDRKKAREQAERIDVENYEDVAWYYEEVDVSCYENIDVDVWCKVVVEDVEGCYEEQLTHDKEKEPMRLNPQPQWEVVDDPPSNMAKLRKVVGNETDLMLSDWKRVLLGEPPLFHSFPPNDWLYGVRGRKREALLWAIDNRLRPTDHTKLKAMLDGQTDWTLYDWACRLRGKPGVSNAAPPPWLDWHLTHGQKRQDLLDAIDARLRRSKDRRVLLYLQTHHGILVPEMTDIDRSGRVSHRVHDCKTVTNQEVYRGFHAPRTSRS